LWLSRKYAGRLRDGDLLLVYLIVYPVGRFLLEFLRLNAAQIAGINFNQTFMAVVAAAAIAGLVYRHRKPIQRAEQEG
jgi:phosphatidylglycerol:prolipoprotein diacylglycerol transferase